VRLVQVEEEEERRSAMGVDPFTGQAAVTSPRRWYSANAPPADGSIPSS